jgi:hypothetical protein
MSLMRERLQQCVTNEFQQLQQEHRRSIEATPGGAAGSNSASSVKDLRIQILSEMQRREKGSQVVGILFCCRRRYTQILLSHLHRNLRSLGGIVDYFLMFNMGTEPNDDHYPLQIAEHFPNEFILVSNCTDRRYGCAYASLLAFAGDHDNTIFVKIDDDVLFIAEDAIDQLVWTKLNSPPHTIVHGNGINHMHAPYFQSQLPLFQQLKAEFRGLDLHATSNPFLSRFFSLDGCGYKSPPLSAQTNLQQRITYLESLLPALDVAFYGRDWQRAETATAHHRLFLDVMAGVFDDVVEALQKQGNISSHGRLKREDLFKFWGNLNMNTADSTCGCKHPQPGYGLCSKFGGYRTSINLVAFQLPDIRDHMDLFDVHDEITMTVILQDHSHVPQVISGGALYAHAAFTPQRYGNFNEFQLLQRYTQLAQRYWGI